MRQITFSELVQLQQSGKNFLVYCRKGIRSQIAIQRLEEKFGCTNLINLRGGIGDKPREEG